MVSAEFARNIVGIAGNVISFGLFLSPSPTFWRIIKNKSVEEFQPYAYLAAALNCMFWVLYGLPVVHPDSILVVTINSVGLVLELIYVTIFFIYSHQNRTRMMIVLWLLGELVFVGAIAGVTFGVFHTYTKRSLFVGVICDIFNIIMYASPLAIVHKVITTKSVEYMPFFLSLAGFANGSIWTAYALIKLDLYILVSNGLGALFGLIQLIIYFIYYKSTPKKSDDVVKPSEVQLSGAARVCSSPISLISLHHVINSLSACRKDHCCHREESSTSESRPRQPPHHLNLVNFLTVSISPRASIDTDIADMILYTNPDSICVELLMELPKKTPKKPAGSYFLFSEEARGFVGGEARHQQLHHYCSDVCEMEGTE
ncbi:hypothetical protein Q3G72_024252 [Acer saccharum]|nr:hypothetical protein Q3G72_024252 [Acer saccharum]